MKLPIPTVVLLITNILNAGCGVDNLVDREKDRIAERAMGAEPISDTYKVCPEGVKSAQDGKVLCPDKLSIPAADVASDLQAKQWIGAAISDSIKKCSSFVARMAYARNASNVVFDITSIGLSAAAAITVPLHSAQALAALAGVSTASKAALDADIFAQTAGPIIAQRIDATYMPGIRAVLAQANNETVAHLQILYGQLLVTHADCTLNAALSAFGSSSAANSVAKVSLTTGSLTANTIITDPVTRLWYRIIFVSPNEVKFAAKPFGERFPDNDQSQSTPINEFVNARVRNGASVWLPAS